MLRSLSLQEVEACHKERAAGAAEEGLRSSAFSFQTSLKGALGPECPGTLTLPGDQLGSPAAEGNGF